MLMEIGEMVCLIIFHNNFYLCGKCIVKIVAAVKIVLNIFCTILRGMLENLIFCCIFSKIETIEKFLTVEFARGDSFPMQD